MKIFSSIGNFFKNTIGKVFTIPQAMMVSYAKKKAGLYEGDPVEGKMWYSSQTVISGGLLVLINLYHGVSWWLKISKGIDLPDLPPQWLQALDAGLGLSAVQGRMNAHKPIVFTSADKEKPLGE